ncbi:hypothetical protein BH11PSE3_BH11PSE3_45640 [soil metagenome]
MSFAPLVLRWRLTPGASLARSAITDLVLTNADGTAVILTPGHAGLRDALLALCDGADEKHLMQLVGAQRSAHLYYHLSGLVDCGALEANAVLDGTTVVRLVPRHLQFELPMVPELPQSVVLDRFAFLRRGERGALLQHPEAACDLVLEGPAAIELVGHLAARPIDVDAFGGTVERALVTLLLALGFVRDVGSAEEASRRSWEFHDRLFQRTTRFYRDLTPRGGTYRFLGALPAPPAVRPAYAGRSITLPRLPAGGSAASRSLLDVMETRRSRRAMSETPVGLESVGEVLHRVARVTAVLPGSREVPQDALLRPYPSGGAIHELEFYLAVRACEGLEPGFYHYRGLQHALTQIAGAEAPAAAMLKDCGADWGQPDQPPQVLVVIASRLPRLAWKYAGIAYRISLMNAGVAIQSLYLVTTDLDLAGSAQGPGNPELFAQATGVSSWEETSIAGFGFGRPA